MDEMKPPAPELAGAAEPGPPGEVSQGPPFAAPAREPWLAVQLSWLMSGLGHYYAGDRVLGICIAVLMTGLSVGGIALLLLPEGGVIAGAVMIGVSFPCAPFVAWHAHGRARARNSPEAEKSRTGSKDAWRASFFSLLFPGLGQAYLGRWGEGAALAFGWIALCCGAEFPGTLGDPEGSAERAVAVALPKLFNLVAAVLAYFESGTRREHSSRAILALTMAQLVMAVPMVIPAILLRAYKIPSGSMEPTLHGSEAWPDRVLAISVDGTAHVPGRGEVITYKHADGKRMLMKRVVGLPGETVEIRDDEKVYIDGRPLTEAPFDKLPYQSIGGYARAGDPFLVPQDALFLLGDNSRHSKDSRYEGAVPLTHVRARVYKIWWPPRRAGPVR